MVLIGGAPGQDRSAIGDGKPRFGPIPWCLRAPPTMLAGRQAPRVGRVRSALPVRGVWPSGLKATVLTLPLWRSKRSGSMGFARSQR